MTLKRAIREAGLSCRKFAALAEISKSAVHRLVHYGEYPRSISKAELQRRAATILAGYGIGNVEMPAVGIRPEYSGLKIESRNGAPITRYVPKKPTEEIELMQLDRGVLQLFGLRVNPFLNDVESDDDVYPWKGHDQVATAIKDTIEQRGFLAVVGPSGAGKTTIWDGIEAEYGSRDDTVICTPMLKHREKLSPEHLVRALLYGLLGEGTHVWHEGEKRGRQLSHALRAIRTGTSDRKAVLYIDDAHYCSSSTLRQLKTFYEEKIGRFRLLGIILVGMPELKHKLSAFPEIGNRIRLVEVPPVPAQEYLQFKFKRVGSALDKIFDHGGLEAFLERFRQPRRQAMSYPLILNSACTQAMKKLHQNAAQPGERISREIVDQLPGGNSPRRVA